MRKTARTFQPADARNQKVSQVLLETDLFNILERATKEGCRYSLYVIVGRWVSFLSCRYADYIPERELESTESRLKHPGGGFMKISQVSYKRQTKPSFVLEPMIIKVHNS